MTRRSLASLTVVLGLLCSFQARSGDAPQPGAAGVPPATQGRPSVPTDPAFRNLRGEWLRDGPGFACQVVAPKQIPREAIAAGVLARACLHMGPFVIGGDAQTVRSALGPPHRTLPPDKGAVQEIYFLEHPGSFPYLVATIAKGRIVALQVTGPAAAKDFGFNHVDLGAETQTLLKYFGQPKHLAPSGVKDTDLWSYSPWPFSFEIKDDHVTSIRIADPEHF